MKNLIEALRETADGIEGGRFRYDWFTHSACNCGLVAATILEISQTELLNRIIKLNHLGCWKQEVRKVCPATGLPLSEVICSMMQVGMTHVDIFNLEDCNDAAVLGRMGCSERDGYKCSVNPKYTSNRTDPAFVTRYMRAWADILEEEQDAKLEIIELRELKPIGDVGRTQAQIAPTLCQESCVDPEGGKK